MDLLTLSYFVKLSETKSISKLAEREFISRQAISQSLQRLEKELGTTLLVRNHDGVELTPEGESLLRHAKRILDIWADAVDDLEAIRRTRAGTLRVGYGHMSFNLWGEGHAARFLIDHPDIRLEIRVMLPDELFGALRARELDVIVVSARGDEPDFASTLLKRQPLMAFLRRDDPLSAHADVVPADLNERTLFFLPHHQRFAASFQQLLLEDGVHAEIRFNASHEIFSAFSALRSHPGSLYFTSDIVSHYIRLPDDLISLPFTAGKDRPMPSKDIYAVTLRDRGAVPLVEQYIRFLSSLLGS